ncbi:MAG: hypothetical protein ACXVFK_16270 [Solirubrobacteraceae bacterium]
MMLTDEQRALWKWLGLKPPPKGTDEADLSGFAYEFRHVCLLQGVERPSVADVLDEIASLT